MAAPRFHVETPLQPGPLSLPATVARHVRVLRLAAGDGITLFDGAGGEWQARLHTIERNAVVAEVETHQAIDREAARPVHIALGMPTNDRMDTLVEKATELGVASIQPLMTERSVLRLDGERAAKKAAHWQGVAIAACEQCGRNRVPQVMPIQSLTQWLSTMALGSADAADAQRWVLSTAQAPSVTARLHEAPTGALSGHAPIVALSGYAPIVALSGYSPIVALSGPEGGLSEQELALANTRGFAAVSLGPRVLRADTAPLALLALLTLNHPPTSP
jgi:16S rRNA (uracil1498-N3)-methyltransferase